MEIAKKARENFSIGAFYNITKNQDNPIKTVGRDSFLSPKTPKNQVLGSPSPQGSHGPYILGDTTTPRHLDTYIKQKFELLSRRISDADGSLTKFPRRCSLVLPRLGLRRFCDKLRRF